MAKKIKEVKEYSPALTEALKKFYIRPDVYVTKKQKKILEAVAEMAEPDFYDLCDWFDMRPSKLDMHLYELEDQGLVTVEDETAIVRLTERAEAWLDGPWYSKKDENKFRKFLESLSEEELKDFCDLCDTFDADGELPAEPAEEPEAPVKRSPGRPRTTGAKKPAAEKTTENKDALKKPAAKRSAAKKPAAKKNAVKEEVNVPVPVQEEAKPAEEAAILPAADNQN